MTTENKPAPAVAAVPDKAELRAEIENARREYYELLNSLTRADWKRTSTNPAWTVGQLMYHMALGADFTANGIESAKKGKGFNPPMWDFVNIWGTKLLAMRATKASAKRKYDEATVKLLAALDNVQDSDWQKGAKNFGDFQTVENLFHSIKAHVDEHGAQIRGALK